MRVLLLYAHPNPESFCASLMHAVHSALCEQGHSVDLCDLYAERFDPVLTREERLGYHAIPQNVAPVADHVARLRAAEWLVVVAPVWNFGWPAILKGYLDRVFLPGVSFRIENGTVHGALDHIRRISVVTTYGATRWRALLARDPPRAYVMRVLRALTGLGARIRYLAHYDMNRSTDTSRKAFLVKVGKHFRDRHDVS